jgi:hypothetical protein
VRRVCREVGIPEEAFRELPRHLRMAGIQGGAGRRAGLGGEMCAAWRLAPDCFSSGRKVKLAGVGGAHAVPRPSL